MIFTYMIMRVLMKEDFLEQINYNFHHKFIELKVRRNRVTKPINVPLADRINNLPPYLFEAIDRMKQEALAAGVDLIDVSIGDPDIPTPSHIIERMKAAIENPENHRYPSSAGMLPYRRAVSEWYKRRFGVTLDPKTETLSLIGSKEGVAHIPLAFINPGDVVLYTSPGYPVYPVGPLFAGGKTEALPLTSNNGFLPDLKSISQDVLDKAKLFFFNYPNNPTTTCATREFFDEVVEFASRNNIIACHDAAYSEIYFDGKRPISFLEVDGAMDVGIELHSLSKTYNMTGWRLGFAAGNKDIVAGLAKIKSNMDSGVFQAIQEAGIAALETEDSVLAEIRNTYQERRDALAEGLRSLGLEFSLPEASFYIWTKIPTGYTSGSFVELLLNKAGILATPGNGFGDAGEGYVRFALTVPVERIREAAERMKKVL